MKRFLFFAIAVMLFAACSKDAIDEQQGIQNIVDEAPTTLTVGFEDDETRIQLNEAQKTVWTNGDLVSVFYRSDANQQWKYDGETGARTGSLKRVSTTDATTKLPKVVVVYPYNENYYINPVSCNIEATMPAEQTYLKDSYGLDGNIMVSSDEFNQISLKSVYGWLKLQLTGNGEQIKSITVRGNSGEQMAGLVYIDSSDATITLAAEMGSADDPDVGGAGGNLVFEDTVLTEVTLNCIDGTSPTEKGVTLGAEATAFYIALPPQTFTKGITVDITAIDGSAMTKTTDNEVVIERNHIKPMAAFGYNGVFKPANNEIYYTNGSTTAPTAPNDPTAFGDVTIQSNTYDVEKECWVLTFDKDVTKIGDLAFYGYQTDCNKLTSVTIPDSVTTIGSSAFAYCTSLTSVTIPDSVKTIGECAFAGCKSLKEFKGKFAADGGRCLIKDNTIIAYAEASGTTYTIPDSVTTIGSSAFSWCDSLTSVTIPYSVTTIGYFAFGECKSLTSVTIPNSVTTIGDWAFTWCDSLKTVYCKPTTPPTGSSSMFSGNASDRKIYVPASDDDSIIKAYKEASGWSEYKDYIFEEGPANNEIYYTNGSTTAPTAPKETAAFGSATIQSNTYDAEKECWVITFDKDIKEIGNYAFEYCQSLTSVTIPDSVTTIGDSAFYYCDKLTSVTIGNSVTTIGEAAFKSCCSLTSVTIPNSVTTIGNYAFEDCSRLTSVTIPDSVTTIGDSAFYYCDKLASVTIGNSVTTIGEAAFNGCVSLKTVYCKPTTPPSLSGSSVFDNNGSGRKIYVPAESVDAYKSATNWSEYADYIEEDEPKPANNEIWYTNGSTTAPTAPYNTAAFGDATIQSNSYDAEKECWVITFDKDITKIGDFAFYNCSITSVTIPESVTTIGTGAFAYCDSLTSVTIPNSVTTIGKGAFSGCESLKEFKGKFAADNGRCLIKDNTIIAYAEASGTTYTIPDSVTTIGNYAFNYCPSLTSVTIPDSVTTIGDYAFQGCTSLTSVTIPDSVTTIGEEAFSGCKSLKEFKGKFAADNGRCLIMDNTIIAYAEASGTTYTIPDSVTTIGSSAFSNCDSLTSVTIGDSVTTIGEDAFSYCDSLTNVTIGNSVTTIEEDAFYGCDSLKEFKGKFAADNGRCLIMDNTIIAYAEASGTTYTIPDSVTTIGVEAFRGCDSLTSVTIPNSVKTIGDWAFSGCDSLTSVTIPDSVTTIGDWAFNACDSLTSVTIPDSVTTIGEDAFRYCYSLKTVYCKPTTPPAGGRSMFDDNASGRKIYVPASDDDSIINAYKAKEYWSYYADYIEEDASL